MTSTTDTAGHPDVAEISDLTEGLLPAGRGTEIRHHLDSCELCADVHASLDGIRGLLGSLPEAERMPADVAGRIDAALAAEARRSAEGDHRSRSDDGGLSGDGGQSDQDGESDAAHVSRETLVPSDRPAGRPKASTGPGRKGREHGRRRRHVVLGTVLTAAVLGAGALALQSLQNHSSSDTTAHGQPTPAVGPFSGTSVQSQVKGLLHGHATRQGTGSESPHGDVGTEQNTPGSTQSANTLLQTAPPVPDCVREALRANDTVLGSKAGTYGGKAAYLVVVPDAADGKRVTAYVVDAACVRQQATSAGKVLLKQSLARP
ncbi:anti-sigma factor family protein [Streptomyces sp. NPDC051452]|uniref:anti-sigma factor family protein n=1 Tax=Streptomyces sp. NPDC051452 TaxID=3365654 RepID=UPI00378E9CA1